MAESPPGQIRERQIGSGYKGQQDTERQESTVDDEPLLVLLDLGLEQLKDFLAGTSGESATASASSP